MREIKFKVWDLRKKEWAGEGYPIDLNYSFGYNGFFFDNDCFDAPKEFVMVQFTGLKDKNGTDIYEGDILKATDIYIGIVKYDKGAYYFESKQDTLNNSWIHILDSKYYEILGNEYENADLLCE